MTRVEQSSATPLSQAACSCWHSLHLQILQEYTLIMGGLNASRKLHSRLLERVMRLPMSFFDSQPSGRLLNRFTKDTEAVDTQILVGLEHAVPCECAH